MKITAFETENFVGLFNEDTQKIVDVVQVPGEKATVQKMMKEALELYIKSNGASTVSAEIDKANVEESTQQMEGKEPVKEEKPKRARKSKEEKQPKAKDEESKPLSGLEDLAPGTIDEKQDVYQSDDVVENFRENADLNLSIEKEQAGTIENAGIVDLGQELTESFPIVSINHDPEDENTALITCVNNQNVEFNVRKESSKDRVAKLAANPAMVKKLQVTLRFSKATSQNIPYEAEVISVR